MTRKTEQPSAHLVVIGASAGGISALATLIAALPRDFPAPLVLAQHLSPEHPSQLGVILAQRSALPVRTVTDSETLVPGVVVVVPSNRHVEIVDGTVHLSAERRGRPKPSIDLLFRSAAQAYGDRLIAVILTNTGSDGVRGAREVKKAGGTVVIQNPETAAFPALPRALAPTTVDIVADLERIGPLLRDLLSRTGAPHRQATRRRCAHSSTTCICIAGSTSAATKHRRSCGECNVVSSPRGCRPWRTTTPMCAAIPTSISGWSAASSSK